jgi:hypothetical protein
MKNLIDTAVKYEIYNNIDEALDVLVELKFIEPSFLTQSVALCWLESEPSENDKITFLEKSDYEM